MHELIQLELDGVVAHVAHSSRADGDLSPSAVEPALLAERRSRAVPLPWHVVHQVHSDRVHTVHEHSASHPRAVADALTTSTPGLALAVHSGDCVPVGLIQSDGHVGAAHAGWKGLESGILESTVRRLRSSRADTALAPSRSVIAVVGPHIRSSRYEFGARDLDRLARRFGDDVVATTNDGLPALDLTAAVANELARLDVDVRAWSPDCTASQADSYWSHRARAEAGRIALVAWTEVVA